MVIQKLKKVQAHVVTDIVGQDGPYVEVSGYAVKKKLDELVETTNQIIDFLTLCRGYHGDELVAVDPEIPVTEDGHDMACNTGIGGECDCWANPAVRKRSSEAMEKMRKAPCSHPQEAVESGGFGKPNYCGACGEDL